MKTFLLVLTVGVVAVLGVFLVFGNDTPADNAADITNLIQVHQPQQLALITSPLLITGQARGTWYFEASFPARLLDANGVLLAQAPVQAVGEWMTEEFVPFNGELTFGQPTTETGTLVLKKDNPSGLPEYDKELRIPVRFRGASQSGDVQASFNTSVTLEIGQRAVIGSELMVTLKEINDSRCKPEVQCVWAGELAPVLVVDSNQALVQLGTVNNKSAARGDYLFTLSSATEQTATFSVAKKISAVEPGTGTLEGYAHIGPTCPVVRAGEEEECDDKAYADGNVLVVSVATKKNYMTTTRSTGTFSLTLPVGAYAVKVNTASSGSGGQPQAMQFPFCEEKSVTITAGQTTTVDIGCDSGIR